MNISSILECLICFNRFDIEEYIPRLLGKCGHTIC